MSVSVIIYNCNGALVPFEFLDSNLYDLMKDTLSSEAGQTRYGMSFVAGKKDIPDGRVEDFHKMLSETIGRINRGHPVSLEKEVAEFS